MDNSFTQILFLIFVSYIISNIIFPIKEIEEKEEFCFLGIGDCGTTNTNVTNTVNNTVTNIVKENAQSCGSTTGISQMIKISDLKAKGNIELDGVSQDSIDNFDFSCMQVSENQVELEKKLQEEIKNNIEQKTSGYQFQPTELTTINNAINNLSTNVKSSSISKCISNKFINQEINIKDLESTDGNITIKNIAEKAIMAGTAKCMQSNTDITKSIEEIQKIIDTKSSQVATGVDMFASITALGTAYITGIVICVVCLSIVSIVSSIGMSGGFSKGSGGGGGSTQQIRIPQMPIYQPQPIYQPPIQSFQQPQQYFTR